MALYGFRSLISLSLGFLLPAMIAAVGINYGQIASNLPDPKNVIPLLRQIGATKVKLYDADPKVLTAFANSGVEFIVCVRNEDLGKVKDCYGVTQVAMGWAAILG